MYCFVMGVSILALPTIFLLDFGIVPTVRYFVCFSFCHSLTNIILLHVYLILLYLSFSVL